MDNEMYDGAMKVKWNKSMYLYEITAPCEYEGYKTIVIDQQEAEALATFLNNHQRYMFEKAKAERGGK